MRTTAKSLPFAASLNFAAFLSGKVDAGIAVSLDDFSIVFRWLERFFHFS